MTDVKKVTERPMKFYYSFEDAEKDNYVCIDVECEGTIAPHSLIKTVLKDKSKVIAIGENLGSISAENLASAKFQLVKFRRNTPTDFVLHEDVYIFESFVD